QPRLALARAARSGSRTLGAAGLGWFLLIAIGFTGSFVVVLPLPADPLANDLTHVYIAVSIARAHGWSHIYSLVLQQDLFERLRPHAVWNDGAWFTPAPPYAWLVFPLTLLGAAGAVDS